MIDGESPTHGPRVLRKSCFGAERIWAANGTQLGKPQLVQRFRQCSTHMFEVWESQWTKHTKLNKKVLLENAFSITLTLFVRPRYGFSLRHQRWRSKNAADVLWSETLGCLIQLIETLETWTQKRKITVEISFIPSWKHFPACVSGVIIINVWPWELQQPLNRKVARYPTVWGGDAFNH